MSPSFELHEPDHFTAGAVGPQGERVFYLQGREGRTLVTLKCEKEQIGALADYLARLLERLPPAGEIPSDGDLLEPLEPAWAVASIGVGYDEARDRIALVAAELVDDEEETTGEPATARFALTRSQAAVLVERGRALIKAGRPICPLCTGPMDPGGHICPRSNGHVVR
jgi:uncharacterized repeat protein (TIGR03847 family)